MSLFEPPGSIPDPNTVNVNVKIKYWRGRWWYRIIVQDWPWVYIPFLGYGVAKTRSQAITRCSKIVYRVMGRPKEKKTDETS